MTEPIPLPVNMSVTDICNFVRKGLAQFSKTHGLADKPGNSDAKLRKKKQSGRALDDDWADHVAGVGISANQLNGPLGTLARDFDLDLAGLFLVTLCGEVEADHSLALGVARLQGDNGPAHPQLHLIAALYAALFNTPVSAVDLVSHPLVTSGVLNVTFGQQPAPFATLSMHARLWAILLGKATTWEGVRPIETDDDDLLPKPALETLDALAEQVGSGAIKALVLRGAPDSTLAAACEVAGIIGMIPVHCDVEVWENQPAFHAACRYGRWLPVVRLRLGPGDWHRPRHTHIAHPVMYVLGGEGGVSRKDIGEFKIPSPDRDARAELWARWTDDETVASSLGRSAALDAATINTIGRAAQLAARRFGEETAKKHLVYARRQQVAENLLRLAQPVAREVERDALILPSHIGSRFDDLIARCEEREALWDGLGPALSEDRNLGVHALFVGPSGTGKTFAVSHLATRLGTPLYRLDLSAVMNKFIGETEKNLSAALDEAADLEIILLMDEADALFGRRSDGEEEGQRFGNMLTNFLLTRIETHPGIIVLTSNSRARIDPAFTRRLHAIIEFPAPGFEERLAIWKSHLGSRSPGESGVRLLASQCDLAGGFIRTAVLAAAARVPLPAEGGAIPVAELARSAAAEYEKLGRTLPAGLAELAG